MMRQPRWSRVMQQMQQLGNMAKSLSAGQEAEVFLAVTATFPLKPVLDVVGTVRAEYPATHKSKITMARSVHLQLRVRSDPLRHP
jgi:hypothetical protein